MPMDFSPLMTLLTAQDRTDLADFILARADRAVTAEVNAAIPAAIARLFASGRLTADPAVVRVAASAQGLRVEVVQVDGSVIDDTMPWPRGVTIFCRFLSGAQRTEFFRAITWSRPCRPADGWRPTPGHA